MKKFVASELSTTNNNDVLDNGTLVFDPSTGLRLHDGSTSGGNPIGGGSSFDQQLNTSNGVSFANINSGDITTSGQINLPGGGTLHHDPSEAPSVYLQSGTNGGACLTGDDNTWFVKTAGYNGAFLATTQHGTWQHVGFDAADQSLLLWDTSRQYTAYLGANSGSNQNLGTGDNVTFNRIQTPSSLDFMNGGYPYMGIALENSGDTLNFKTNISSSDYTANVLSIDRTTGVVTLNGGTVHVTSAANNVNIYSDASEYTGFYADNLNAGDEIAEMFSAGGLWFYSDTDGNAHEWSMRSDGTFFVPGNVFSSVATSDIGSSGNPFATGYFNTISTTNITANSTNGTAGQVLTSNGSGLYWSSVVGAGGYTGSRGSTGYTGSAGTNGTNGYTGSQGSQGTTGYTGSIGSQGTTGYTGSIGSQGTTGYTGSVGSQGTTGYTGSVGSQGTTGYTGSAGNGLSAGANNQIIYRDSTGTLTGANNLTFDGTNLAVNGNITASGNLITTSGYVRTTASTGYLFNTIPTTVYIAGGATVGTIIGNSSGTITLNGNVISNNLTAGIGGSSILKIGASEEGFTTYSTVTGVYNLNCANGNIFNITPSGGFTPKFNNFVCDNNFATALTLVINQGGTAYVPTSNVDLGTGNVTVSWQGGSAPSGNINKKDIVTYSILNASGTYTVLGQLVTFG